MWQFKSPWVSLRYNHIYVAYQALSIWIKRSQRDRFCFLALVAEHSCSCCWCVLPLLHGICGLTLAVGNVDLGGAVSCNLEPVFFLHEVSLRNQPEIVCWGTFYLLDGFGNSIQFVWWCPTFHRILNGACIV